MNATPEGKPGGAEGDSRRRERQERFADLMNYALAKLGAERGAMQGAQSELAAALGVSSTMIHRYRNGGAEFDALKVRTVVQLAKVLSFDVGTVYKWVDSGREAALEHERRICNRPVGFTPAGIARELVRMLECYGSALDEAVPQTTPVLQCHHLVKVIRQKREPAPDLFDQLVEILNLAPLLEDLERGGLSDLEPDQWEALGKLLGRGAEDLEDEFLV